MINTEQLKYLCVKVISYEEDEMAVKTLTEILFNEAIKNGIDMSDEQYVVNYIDSKINELIFEQTIISLNNKGLIDIQLDEDGHEICSLSKSFEVEEKKNEY